jgi:hypothetical protein
MDLMRDARTAIETKTWTAFRDRILGPLEPALT